jgi:hypothetical protein
VTLPVPDAPSQGARVLPAPPIRIYQPRARCIPYVPVALYLVGDLIVTDDVDGRLQLGAILAGLLVMVFLESCWFGITLTPTEAVVRSWRVQRIPWSDVQGITQQPIFFRGFRLLLWTSDRCVELRTMRTLLGFGRDELTEDYHQIGRWWLTYRGESWTPTPLTPELMRLPGSP